MAKRKLDKTDLVERDVALPKTRQASHEDQKSDLEGAPPSKKRKVTRIEKDAAKHGKGVKKTTKVVKKEASKKGAVVDNKENVKSAKKGRKKVVVKEESFEPEVKDKPANEKATKTRKKRVVKNEAVKGEADEDISDGKPAKAVKKKRKTKEQKAAEAMPLAARTTATKLFIGAHVSASGGVHNSVLNSVHIGGNAFALFLKSQRKWANPPLQDEHHLSFHQHCSSHKYDQGQHVVPHGSYLVNLAHTDKARTQQAYESFLDDLRRCERLGIKLYNFHPGVANSTGGDRQAAIAHLASNLNRAHKATSTVVTLLENMAHGGTVLGSTFEDLRDTIALVNNKDRVGVCLDTCHAFASGYDFRTPSAFKATMDKLEEIVGIKYLRAVHMNDSKAPFESHKDLHFNIGCGYLGLRAFHNIVNDSRFEGLPLILETPLDARDEDGNPVKDEKGKVKEDKEMWAREIKLLESLVGMDAESEEFLALEKALAKKGAPERKRLADQIEKTREKNAAKAERAAKKKAKKDEKVKIEDASEESALSELGDDDDADEDNVVDNTQRLSD